MKGVRLVPLNGGPEPRPPLASGSGPRSRATQPIPPAGVQGTPLAEARGLERVYVTGSERVAALRGVNLALWSGRIAVVRGRSGAGKTTLLNLLAGLDEPTAGAALLFGADLSKMTEEQRTQIRREALEIGRA